MSIDEMTREDLQELMRTSQNAMTRVVLMETSIVGEVSSVNILIIEPLAPAEDDA